MPAVDLTGWTPVRARPQGRELIVQWRWLDGASFREPFFAETVQLALQRPFTLLVPVETAIEALAELEPGLEPNGFILHVSRCGSTLVTQMLAAVPEYLVLSEPLLVNDVLRAPGTDDEHVSRLRLAVTALGRPPTGAERAYVLKLDAWATHDLPLLRRAFPETPWLFLSRDPLEVLVSQRLLPGMHMFPRIIPPELFGLDLDSATAMPFEEYGARVLGAICDDALTHRDKRALFVDYRELPGAVFDQVIDWFGLECSADDRVRMEAASGRNAKIPSRTFTGEPEEKTKAATPELRAAVDRWARPAYEELAARSRCT